MTPEELIARLLYRDALMLVIDKPAGLPVHAGPGRGPNLEALFGALRFGLPRRPGLAHRLDRDTSGCLVLGRHRQALARLSRLFAAGTVEKTYWALVQGAPPAESGIVDLALAKRSDQTRGWWMKIDPGGQKAVTEYRVLARGAKTSWVEFRPRTGRTHQIRVHAQALGCPVLGDSVYGGAERDKATLQLHARGIVIPLYSAKPPIAVSAKPPPHMAGPLAQFGYDSAKDETRLP